MDQPFDTTGCSWRVKLGRKLFPYRGFMGVPFLLLCLLVCRPQAMALSLAPLGWAILGLGLFFRTWGVAGWYPKGSKVQGSHLITEDGPYPYSRNPRYVGNLLMGLGACTLAALPQCTGPYLLLWAGIHLPIIEAEEAVLLRRYGQPFADYCQRVPRFWGLNPQAPPLARQIFGLSWKEAQRAELATQIGWLVLGLVLSYWRDFCLR